MATIITKKKKVSVSATKTVVTISPTKIRINQTFRRIKDIATKFGASIPPRKCFGFIEKDGKKTNIAIWCPSHDPGTPWSNVLTDHGNTLIEKRRSTLSLTLFQECLRKQPNYDVNNLRMVFLKFKKKFYFIGFFQVDVIDFTNRTVSFKKVYVPTFTISIQKKKVTVIVEEETIENTLFVQSSTQEQL